jgi:serine/threonine-protein kinase
VKILDFGIAKLQGPIDSMSSHKTRTGTLMGTPLYMSPEQCLGVREVDHRTDIYSLGCILYEMLCGAPPFVSEGFGALINMHINQPPDRASQHNPEVTPAVERVLLRMLAKRPIDRVSTMAEVQDALFPIIATASGRSRTGTTPHPGQPLPKISSLALSATTLSASAASAAGVLTSPAWQRRRRTVGAAVAAGAVAVVAVLFFTARARMSATAPAPAPPAAAVTATPAAPDPAAAPAPAARLTDSAETIDVALESEPDGAMVMANGAAIGTTPMIWETTPGGQPVTLTFVLDGYRREVIQAVPAKGLRLAPTLKKAPSHRPRPVAAGRGPAGAAAPDDIKSER